jgi:hypothetical protein
VTCDDNKQELGKLNSLAVLNLVETSFEQIIVAKSLQRKWSDLQSARAEHALCDSTK